MKCSNIALPIFVFVLFFSTFCQAGDPLILSYKTDNPGTSDPTEVTIFTVDTLYYNYSVDWGDGTSDTGVTGDITHDYGTVGTYDVSINGTFPAFKYDYPNTDNKKLIEIKQWGDIQWKTMAKAFKGCINLDTISATDAPDLSTVEDMSEMFHFGRKLKGDLSGWNVSNVTNMFSMFYQAYEFTSDLSGWDVSNVTNMQEMFTSCYVFNSDLSGWHVDKVTNMGQMFYYAYKFTSDLSGWQVSEVTNMKQMFSSAKVFTSDLSGWDVSKVDDMTFLFSYAKKFTSDLSGWDVSKVESMSYMFTGAVVFTSDLGDWNLNMVSTVSNMFSNSKMSLIDYDNTLKGWADNPNTPNNLSLGSTSLTYCLGETARNTLTNTKGWTISGDSKACAISNFAQDDCFNALSKEISSVLENNNQEVYFADSLGNYICMINAQGNDLGNVDVSVFLSSTPRAVNIPFMDRDITITPANQPNTSNPVLVSLFYTTTDLNNLMQEDQTINGVSDVGFTKTDGTCTGVFAGDGTAVPQSSSSMFGNVGYSIEGNVSSFSTFHSNKAGLVLPLRWIGNLEANMNNGNISVNWNVANEIGVSYYEILHSKNNRDLVPVGKVSAAQRDHYQWKLINPDKGNHYFQIKAVDFDGKIYFSSVVNVNNNFAIPMYIYPNPAADFIRLEDVENQSPYSIYSLTGKMLIKGDYKDAIDITSLSSGSYLLQIDGQNLRFIKL